jgi:hypothetical protein
LARYRVANEWRRGDQAKRQKIIQSRTVERLIALAKITAEKISAEKITAEKITAPSA